MMQPKTRPSAKRATEGPRSTKTRAPSAPERHGRAERRLERRCEALRLEIEALERARAELCSTLSHDLRNPLTVVVWSLQMLSRRVPPEDSGRRHLDAVVRGAEELNQMLHELSDAARIADGRLALSLVLEPNDLAALIEQAVAPNRTLAQGKELELAVDVAPHLPPIPCDRERISRVLATLVANAARRTPKRGTVLVRAARDAEGVRLLVSDSGPEIPAEDRPSLFALPSPPPPGVSRRPRPVSPAIALYVARGVIEGHGGELYLEDASGRGNTFVLTLPIEA